MRGTRLKPRPGSGSSFPACSRSRPADRQFGAAGRRPRGRNGARALERARELPALPRLARKGRAGAADEPGGAGRRSLRPWQRADPRLGGHGRQRAGAALPDRPGGRRAAFEPLVVEPEFLHVSPRLSADGAWLAYSCNRRNGRDLDVFVRSLATGAERCVFSPGSYCEVAGFSPDGRWLGVLRLTERTGDNDLHLVDLEGDETFLVAPDEHDAFFGEPAWGSDPASFLFATDSGSDVAGIARYDIATRTWEYVLAGRLGSRLRRRRARPLARRARERRRLLATRPPRPGDADARPPPRAPGRGRRRPRQALGGRPAPGAFGFSSPRRAWEAWHADLESGEAVALTQSPTRVDPDAARAPGAPEVRLVRRRVGPVLPLRAGDRAALAGRRRGARRAGGPAAADVVSRRAVPRLDAGSPWRSRTCGAPPGTASATSTSTTVRSASTRCAT